MPSTMAPTKAMARYAVIMLNLPANVMTLLLGWLPLVARCGATIMVNRVSPFKKVSLAVARHWQALLLARADMVKEH